MTTINDLIKAISAEQRKAQNCMFSRKYAEALELLVRVDSLINEAEAMDAEHVQLKSLVNQYSKMKRDLDQKTGSAQATPPASSQTVSPAGETKPAGAKLPAGVDKRIRDMNQLIARGKTEDAVSVFREIGSQYGGQFDTGHPDYSEKALWVESALASMAAQKDAKQAEKEKSTYEREEKERLSSVWTQKLKALPLFGFNIADQDDLTRQQKAFEDARVLMDEYRAVDFPYGKQFELEQIEQEVHKRIEGFPQALETTRKRIFDEVDGHLRSRLDGLGRVIEGKPSFMSESSVAETRRWIEERSWIFVSGGTELDHFDTMQQQILEINEINKKEREKLIFLNENIYSGDDAMAIREYIQSLVKTMADGGQVLRTVIYKPEWKELSQWEDYAGTQRFVTRGEIYGQSVARVKGKLKLFTVYITRERKSDGSWTTLTGNIMFSDDMAEENLK